MYRFAGPPLVAALALLLSACGAPAAEQPAAASQSDSPTERTATIDVENIAFSPPTMTVLPSTTVTWVNHDAEVRHTATSGTPGDAGVPGVSDATPSKPDGLFDGDLPQAGAEFAFTFSEAGTYAYFCEVHPSMVGTVVVE